MATLRRAKHEIVDDPLTSPRVWDKALEEAFVGWLVATPEAAVEVCGALRHQHFHGYIPREIFKAVEVLVEASQAAHLDAIGQALERLRSDVTKIDVLRIMEPFPLRGGWEDRARLIREGARRRALTYALQQARDRLLSDEIDEIRSDLYAVLDDCADSARPVERDGFRHVMRDVWDDYHSGSQLIATGIGSIDHAIRGIRRGTFTIIGARTSVGKTALAVTLATGWASLGLRVSVISVEMKRVGIGQRYAGVLGNISVAGLNAGEVHPAELERLSEICALDLPMMTDDTSRTMAQVRARVMQHRRALGGIDVIIVDYVQLLQGDREGEGDEKRYREIGKISQQLKFLADDTGAVVITLAQLNRGADQRNRPKLSDLRESGNLEQDADQVWLLWRNEKKRCMELEIAKNRQGPTGRVSLMFAKAATKFIEHVADAEAAAPDEDLPYDDEGNDAGAD